jgi:GH24 family phage-related lysozyme (muramidase)
MSTESLGYGHDCAGQQDCGTIHAPITKDEAKRILRKDLASFAKCVCQLPNAAALNANQFAALVSFAFDSSCDGVFRHWKVKMSEKDFNGICSALPHTNTANGVLNSRRVIESAVCFKATKVMSGCYTPA